MLHQSINDSMSEIKLWLDGHLQIRKEGGMGGDNGRSGETGRGRRLGRGGEGRSKGMDG